MRHEAHPKLNFTFAELPAMVLPATVQSFATLFNNSGSASRTRTHQSLILKDNIRI
jgi:hypothetical protein